jgi:hypothetical protein
MAVAAGSHRLGPDNASLVVRTYREGMASKVGHDLVLEVTDWTATLAVGDAPSLQLRADPRSLRVRDALHGLKPLSANDRDDIQRNIEQKVLGTGEITFRSRHVATDDDRLTIDGDLTLAGTARPVGAEVVVGTDGSATTTIPLTQSEWGIKPYRGLMGALKVRDEVEIVVEARLPTA